MGELREARELVEAWSAPWKHGVVPAVVSALDVLVGDSLELDFGRRPDGTLVEIDGGVARVDEDALGRWTLERDGFLARVLGMNRRWLLHHLVHDDGDSWLDFQNLEPTLSPADWTSLADMEVVSLAMGHFGPARQETLLPVIRSWLRAVVAERAAGRRKKAIERFEDAARQARVRNEEAMTTMASISAAAIAELGRRARERGHAVPDPFALRIHAYLPLLTARGPIHP